MRTQLRRICINNDLIIYVLHSQKMWRNWTNCFEGKSVIRTEFWFDTTRLHGAYTVDYTTFLTYTFLFRSEPLPLDSGYWSRYWPGRKSQIIRSGRSVCSQFQVQILSYFQRDIFYWDKLRRCWHNRKKRWKLPGSNSSSEPEMVLSCHWCGLKMLALVYSPISNFITSYLIVYICGSTTKAKFSFGIVATKSSCKKWWKKFNMLGSLAL